MDFIVNLFRGRRGTKKMETNNFLTGMKVNFIQNKKICEGGTPIPNFYTDIDGIPRSLLIHGDTRLNKVERKIRR